MSIIDELLDIIKKSPNTYARYLKTSHSDVYAFISAYPGSTVPEKCYNAVNNLTVNEHRCQECNEIINKPFISFMKGYRRYCSNLCSSKASIKLYGSPFSKEVVKEKRKQTLINKYGTDSMISVNRQKAIETTRKKYGVDYALQSNEIRTKIANDLLAEHGVSNVFQLPTVIDKIKSTMLGTYGVSHALQHPKLLAKQQQTMITRYGVDSALKNKEIIERVKETNRERYGVDNPMQSKQVSIKSGRTQRKNSVNRGEFDNRIAMFKDMFHVEPLFTADDYINGVPLTWRHVCGHVYTSDWHNGMISVCPHPNCQRISTPQRAVYEYVKSLINDEVMINDRSIITPYELDIFIPSKNLAIEVDGVYWHQNESEILDKINLCREHGISLLHISDLSWYNQTDIWKSIISSKLGNNTKIGARQCEVHEIGNDVVKPFLVDNHFQGYIAASKSIGLFFKNELVAVMTFGIPRFNHSYDWELLRYASKKHLTVVGGASRLLQAFRTLNQGTIITYAKREYSDGSLYRRLNFTLISEGTKSYFYLKDGKMISRYQAQKHKLQKLLGEKFDSTKSERQNMRDAGYMVIQDRGSLVFVLN